MLFSIPQEKHQSFVTEGSEYNVRWSGFQDPHSELAYFRVALGSAPAMDDVVPFVHVGLQTCEWLIALLQLRSPEVEILLPE